MRDIVVFSLFVCVLPVSFLRPWVGLCAFSWLAYNRTQDLTWGFARGLPISQLIAIASILGWMTMEFRPIKLRTPMIKAMVLMLAWITISILANGLNWDLQGRRLTDLAKVILICLMIGAMLINRRRLTVLMAIIALGLGFYGAKNGIMYALGSKSIVGPGGMLKDNNDFGLAMVMNVPLLFYMADEVKSLKYGFFLRRFMKAAFFLSFLTIMSTGSRGAFLALGVALTVMVLKTRWKVPALATMAFVGLLGLAVAPQEYRDRILSIFDSGDELDGSVKGRLVSWQVASRMIQDKPLMGIGLNQMVKEYNNYTKGIINEKGTSEQFARVAHNSYLQIWAESGTPAYLLFMFMLVGTIISLELAGRRFRREGDGWLVPYCNAMEVSLIAYMIGATFLNRSHFDLIYQLVVVAGSLPLVAAVERKAKTQRTRVGPHIAQDVWVRHKDPFVHVGRP